MTRKRFFYKKQLFFGMGKEEEYAQKNVRGYGSIMMGSVRRWRRFWGEKKDYSLNNLEAAEDWMWITKMSSYVPYKSNKFTTFQNTILYIYAWNEPKYVSFKINSCVSCPFFGLYSFISIHFTHLSILSAWFSDYVSFVRFLIFHHIFLSLLFFIACFYH